MDGVGKTSLFVAAMRAVESERGDGEGRLFRDPFARDLAGREGFEILERALAAVGEQPAIAIRTFHFDECMRGALAEGIRQIVVLAAGMDSRAYRMDFPEGTVLFELEREEVLRYKHEKLASAKPRCRREAIAVDLREEWPAKLKRAGMDPAWRTLWLVEGLLMYLDEAAVRSIFAKVSALSAPGSVLLSDILGRTLLESPVMEKQLQFLASLGAAWNFGTDDPEAFLADYGWEAVAKTAGEVCPERWPFPTAPRHVPGVPRGFFVEARKR